VDVAISLNGGMLKFIKGTTPAENKITLLEAKPDGVSSQLEMILVNTNKARNSKSTIEAVMRLRDNDNAKFTQVMTEMGETTSRVLEIYQGSYSKEALAELLMLISINHVLLRDLGVSCDEIERIVDTLDNLGGYSTKLTGAGGGGCVIGFKSCDTKSDLDEASKKLEEGGFSIFEGIQNS
jgi:mevalonate kinase